MPLLYICKAMLCGVTLTRRGYCEKHKHLEVDRDVFVKYAKPRWTFNSLYQTKAWRDLRKKVIDRDGGVCCQCGTNLNIVVDHISNHNGNPDLFYDEANLQLLCSSCHGKKGFRESRAKARKRLS